MPVFDIIAHHDWEKETSPDFSIKAITLEQLVACLNLVKGVVYAIQREDIEELKAIAPNEAVRRELQKFTWDNPAYRIIFLSVEQGSVKARSSVASALLGLALATGGTLAAGTIGETAIYKDFNNTVKSKADGMYDKFKNRLGHASQQESQNPDSKFTYDLSQKDGEMTLHTRPKTVILNEPTIGAP
jgi:hypothetical protein